MISSPPRMAIKKSMARNFLFLNYHVFVAIHPLIAVTFSTPTGVSAQNPDWWTKDADS
jgi:uncharacterized membrane protein